jgi:hypothetical protein
MVWDGKELLTDSEIAAGGGDLAAALGSPGTRRRPADQAPTDPGGFVTEE